MWRRRFVSGAAVIAASTAARAQTAGRPFRIGYIGPGNPDESAFANFRVGLGRIGWVEGRDYVLKTRFAHTDVSRLPALLDPLLNEGIDVLIAAGAPTRLLPAAERRVPVVFSFSGDPVAAGYVRSLAQPGGNSTGNSQMMWELVGKRIELLREIAPEARRTLVVQSPDHPGETEERSRTQRGGEQIGLEMIIKPVRDRAALEVALAEGEAAGCDSLLCFTDSVTMANRHLIADYARQRRIPSVFPRREFCEVGGLASYGPSIPELMARLAVFVKRIAAGERAGSIPVEWPTVVETVANQRTAQSIGRKLPATVLARADEVIE